MPNSSGQPTLLDIAKLNGCDATVGLIEEVIRVSPEVEMGYARTIRGINYRARVRTSLPSAGFRAANQGVTPSASTFENKLFECFMLNPKWLCDKAVADAFEDGAQAFIAMEGVGMMEAAMIQLSKQFYYGTNTTYGGDAAGFPGLAQVVDSSMCIDATGTTQGVAASGTISTSVWAVRFGIRDVSWVYGNNGQLALSAVTEVPNVLDGSSKPYTAYHQEILARPGLQVGSKWSVGKIVNCTSDSAKGVTDKLLGQLLALFPPQAPPTGFFMTIAAREQLRASRTATNPTGQPATVPTDWNGIPILATNGLSNVEEIWTS